MTRRRIALLITLALPLVSFGVLALVWALVGRHPEGEVGTNISVAGVDVSRQSSKQLDATLAELAAKVPEIPVRISTPKYSLNTTVEALGGRADMGATRSATLAAGTSTEGIAAPIRWVGALLSTRDIPLRILFDEETARAAIVTLEGDRRKPSVEPSLNATEEAVTLVPGQVGTGVDERSVLRQLPRTVLDPSARILVSVTPQEDPPAIADSTVAALAKKATEITAGTIELRSDNTTHNLETKKLRPGFKLEVKGSEATLALNPELAATQLAAAVQAPANPTKVRFDIVNGVPTPVAGEDATVCCDADAPQKLITALMASEKSVTLGSRTITAAEGVKWAEGLGVKEVVGEFTTKHPCCVPRVQNIHRISDLTRGALIAPGETFSANEFVGKRTVENGFVSAPVIEDGEFVDGIGGGVSQWATTTFNAAFFAGLEIPEHKAHSYYISRYPFGREATLAYPSVDLKILNNTPYGVVIWPTYTNSSITVQLWSTRFAVGEQTDLIKTKPDCGTVKVVRTTTFVSDGHTENDTYRATYGCDVPKH
jgi:vancomycin resistance protein YoaR